VPATEAAKNFGRLVDRVREERATFVIERGGTAVAQISPVARAPFTMADFKALLSDTSSADETYLRAVERAIERHNRPRVRRNPWAR
jgi:antitoxin (DNA-binding transcriptional repressor) of toxin-antitoxin stability system